MIDNFQLITCLGTQRADPALAVDANCIIPLGLTPTPSATNLNYTYEIGGGTKRVPFVFDYNSVSVACSFQMTYTKEVTLRDTGVMSSGSWLLIDESTSEMVFESLDAAHEENYIVRISSVIT